MFLGLAVSLSACAMTPYRFPKAEAPGADQGRAVAALVAAGYTIKVASDAVVVSEPLEYGARSSGGSNIPTREVAQVAIKDGVASVQMKVECDRANTYAIDPTPIYPPTWVPCWRNKAWPMAEARERFVQVVTSLGGEPPNMDVPEEPGAQ